MRYYVVFSLLVLSLIGCKKVKIEADDGMFLKKEYVLGEKLRITIDSLSDYRCPLDPNINCIWQGDVDVFFKITDGVSTMDSVLHFSIDPTEVTFKNYSIKLLDVSPHTTYQKETSDQVKMLDYKVRMLIVPF
ncbi:hypothetical protein [Jiulongibacter sediminis]|uniref:Lipoprotein n=1 Tax=Jiulongibacter sediminis TaxID=1605367 RepID=A0A0P7BUW2_9BACT|nr:hypothetical protein [Jiulongibacter sediminis]KPM48639.1 hypothetical protein AFM12_08525 [Jiulongibacter sediminis]TBX25176.1 hypothetical protein TK44_08530 [Jiulongibacter sediminis]